MTDTTLLGRLTATVMEWIGDEFEGDWSVRTAMVVAEVDSPRRGYIVVKATDDRPWVQEKFLEEALDQVRRRRDELDELDEPDDDEEVVD